MRKYLQASAIVLTALSACTTTQSDKVPMICVDQDGMSWQTLGGAALGGGAAAYGAYRFIGKGRGKLAATAGAGLVGAVLGGLLAAPSSKCYPDPRYLQPAGNQAAQNVDQFPQTGVIDQNNPSERVTLSANFVTQINIPDQERVYSVDIGNSYFANIQYHYNYVLIKPTDVTGETNLIVHSVTRSNQIVSRQYIVSYQPL